MSLFNLSPSAIVFRDQDLVVVDKPAGLTCQSSSDVNADLPLLLAELLQREDGTHQTPRLFAHQRLDKETSGLIAYGLSETGNAMLKAASEARENRSNKIGITKRYVALTRGTMSKKARLAFEQGAVLEDHLVFERGRSEVVTNRGPNPRSKHVRSKRAHRAKLARSLVRLVESHDHTHGFEIEIETGRTHQIRVQLRHAGFPVFGDRLYGDSPDLHAPRLMLHASELAFDGATEKHRFSVAANFETPADLVESLNTYLPTAALRRIDLHRSKVTNCFRLFHGFGEGAPGIDIDVYGKHLVLHLRSDEALQRENEIADVLRELTKSDFDGLYVKRRPKRANTMTDLERSERAPSEPLFGKPAPAMFVGKENGMAFSVRLASGMSTGIFLDQRFARSKVRELLRQTPASTINLFSYTSAFGLAAALGAEEQKNAPEDTQAESLIDILNVDASGVAIEQSRENFERLGLTGRFFKDDAFSVLTRQIKKGACFGLVICDPPTYATGKRRWKSGSQWRELARMCTEITACGGVMLLSSNDTRMTQGEFRRFVREGVEAAGRQARLRDLPAPRDFPPPVGAAPIPHRLWCVVD